MNYPLCLRFILSDAQSCSTSNEPISQKIALPFTAAESPIAKTVSSIKKRTRPAHRHGLCPSLFHGSKKYCPTRTVILSGAIAIHQPSRSTDCAAQITYQKLDFTGCAGALPASRIILAGTSEPQCATAGGQITRR